MFVLSAYLRQFVRGAWENREFVFRPWDRACGPFNAATTAASLSSAPRAETRAHAGVGLGAGLDTGAAAGPDTGGAVESSSVSFEAAVQLECPPLTAAAPVRLRVVRRVVLVRVS